MAGPKITVVGAGSYFFGKQIIHKMASSEIFHGGLLSLVDVNESVLLTMKNLADRVFREKGAFIKVEAGKNRRDMFPGSDFIVLSFANKGAYYRGIDTKISSNHGIRMCSADTIGPGGIFRAMRELPYALEMAKDAAELAPDSWMINFVNPATVIGIALRRYVPEIKSFTLCDGHHEPYNTMTWCKNVGILSKEADHLSSEIIKKVDLRIGGINHATFMTRFSYDGEDMMPAVRDWLCSLADQESEKPQDKARYVDNPHSYSAAKRKYNATYGLQLFDLYGVFPTNVSHTKEYVPFYQGYGVKEVEPEPIRLFDADDRKIQMDLDWEKTEKYSTGALQVDEFMKKVKDDHASDIIESMWGDLGKRFYVNSPNGGAITNFPSDAIVELLSEVDLQGGVKPVPFGAFPRGVLSLQHQILDAHELTAEAIVKGDRELLLRAMLTDPICNNIVDAKNCIQDLMEAEREALPDIWFK